MTELINLPNLPDLLQPATDLAKSVLEQGIDKLKVQIGADAAAGMVAAWNWLKGRLIAQRAAAGEAVRELEAAPADADNQGAFRQQLKKALADDPAFAAELAERLRALPVPAITQSSVQTGDGNVSTQIAGHHNQVTLR